jgi:CheY-like chemotaxis protein
MLGMPKLSQRTFQGHRILVVDDEADLVEILVEDFSQYGVEVFSAASGQKALAILDREPVTVIVSDLRMPGMDGVELLREVRRRFLQASP